MSFELRFALRSSREKRRATYPESYPQSYTVHSPGHTHHHISLPSKPHDTNTTILRDWCFDPSSQIGRRIENAEKRQGAWQLALHFLEGTAQGVEEKIGLNRNFEGEWKVRGKDLWEKWGGEIVVVDGENDDECDGDGDDDESLAVEGKKGRRRAATLKKTRNGHDLWESGLWALQLGYT